MTQRPTTASSATPYRRRRPERTLLYRTVQTHFETWLALRPGECDDADAVPGYVERDFPRYLECGILAHGFARARCAQWGSPIMSCPRCQCANGCWRYRSDCATSSSVTQLCRAWRYACSSVRSSSACGRTALVAVLTRASARSPSFTASAPRSTPTCTFTVSSSTACSRLRPPGAPSSIRPSRSIRSPSPPCKRRYVADSWRATAYHALPASAA